VTAPYPSIATASTVDARWQSALSSAEPLSLDVDVTRGDVVEAHHRVHGVVVAHDGTLLARAGAPTLVTWWRSCAKPFQALPFVEDGHHAALHWGTEALALACASHGGEPEHVALADAMLRVSGLDESALACGPHEPLSSRGASIARASGAPWTRLHNNCSGKHAAMLARAVREGHPTDGYHLLTHPGQQRALRAVAEWAELDVTRVACASDGCGVPVFGLPLAHMALAYARLGHAAQAGSTAPHAVVSAMTAHPFLVGGTGRFDTHVMEATEGRVVCKIGAEGVHTLAIPARGLGIAVKVEDGAARAQYPAVLALLQWLDALPGELPTPLQPYANAPVLNTRREAVGVVRRSA
jgi:L-asparaginase II